MKYSDTEIRRSTVVELKRIQTIPENFIIEGSYKDVVSQIGNAVACKFAEEIGRSSCKNVILKHMIHHEPDLTSAGRTPPAEVR